jgi:DNA-directed RNA polymerase specialized sigma24 family protein
VAANLAVSGVRRRLAEARALVRLAARQQEPLYAALPGGDGDFWRAVRRLPRRQAQVVALVALGDLSTAEVASTLGCSQRMVQVHLQKARATLTQRLGLPAEQEVDR